MADLKPCPMCRMMPRIEELDHNHQSPRRVMTCDWDSRRIHSGGEYDEAGTGYHNVTVTGGTEAEARENWNRRAEPTPGGDNG